MQGTEVLLGLQAYLRSRDGHSVLRVVAGRNHTRGTALFAFFPGQT